MKHKCKRTVWFRHVFYFLGSLVTGTGLAFHFESGTNAGLLPILSGCFLLLIAVNTPDHYIGD